MNKVKINVAQVLGEEVAIVEEQGRVICNLILREFEKDNCVVLDFSQIKTVISVFARTAIGLLYKNYKEDYIEKHLLIENCSEYALNVINLAKDLAKDMYGE